MLRAEWLVFNVVRPPLYRRLARSPETAQELRRSLGVSDEAWRQNPPRAVRTAADESDVSNDYRVAEYQRFDDAGRVGDYFESFDFDGNGDRSNVSRFPAGPRDTAGGPRSPFDATSFEIAGGEVTWSARNGLHQYLITTADGQRLDEAPVSIVHNELRLSGGRRWSTGRAASAATRTA